MQKTISKLLSIIFHPLFMPTLGLLIFFNSGTYYDFMPYEFKRIMFILILVSTFVLPITFTPFYLFQKLIKNIEMQNKKERIVPFLITAILYFFCFYLLRRVNAPRVMQAFVLASSISVFVIFLLNFKWKISAHMTGIGGLTGAILAMSFLLQVNLELYIIASMIAAGILGYSRLHLQSHKSFEVYSGWIVGFVILSVTLFYY